MKLLKLNIDSHFHLENISFDFTYPKGHTKAGMPLEKICIIGQSASGKTTILDLIKIGILKLDSLEVVGNTLSTLNSSENIDFKLNGSIEYIIDNEILEISKDKVRKGDYLIPYGHESGTIQKLIFNDVKLLYFSSDIVSKENISVFEQNPTVINTDEELKKMGRFYKTNYYTLQFDDSIDKRIWYSLFSNILDYRKKFTQLASDLINRGVIGDMQKLNKEFQKWSQENKNPLEPFANFFNQILRKLNLEVDLINTDFTIPIKSKINDDTIPISKLSTGTKSLLLSMLPLFELDTEGAIILIDEPERSLFPDMQIDLIQHYRSLTPESQIIVATHSPFIAASFEPEERFILYYDENGKVVVRRGESPIGDDPNDILKNDFNIDYYNKFGQDAYKKYVSLKEQMANEGNPQKKKELLREVSSLGDQYKF